MEYLNMNATDPVTGEKGLWVYSEPSPEGLASSISAGMQWREGDTVLQTRYADNPEVLASIAAVRDPVIPPEQETAILQTATIAALVSGGNSDLARSIANTNPAVQTIMAEHPELAETPPATILPDTMPTISPAVSTWLPLVAVAALAMFALGKKGKRRLATA